MKILCACQGNGNGHASRARAILRELARHAEVDVATSGSNFQLYIGHPVTFSFSCFSFRLIEMASSPDGQRSSRRVLELRRSSESSSCAHT
jgi:UDP:flavonoid glycosyltransferase YjiC (YdhE family)